MYLDDGPVMHALDRPTAPTTTGVRPVSGSARWGDLAAEPRARVPADLQCHSEQPPRSLGQRNKTPAGRWF